MPDCAVVVLTILAAILTLAGEPTLRKLTKEWRGYGAFNPGNTSWESAFRTNN
jgi:hypothetical protein